MPDIDIVLPEVPTDLLEALEGMFPDKAPSLNESLDLIRYKAGQVSVVRFLRNQHTCQHETVLGLKESR